MTGGAVGSETGLGGMGGMAAMLLQQQQQQLLQRHIHQQVHVQWVVI